MADDIKSDVDKDYPDIDLGPGETVQSIISKDTIPPNESERRVSWYDMGNQDIDIDRYLTREYHELEKEKIWKKTWQVACREEEIPNVGDYYVYDICDDSIIVTRTAEDEITAYVNACLHRGNALALDCGHKKEFRCPYHGWTWALDGTLRWVPGEWDFGHVDKKCFNLPSVKVDTWGGFVFINLDDDCAPLREYLEILPDLVSEEDMKNRYKAVHVSQVVPCNWKVVQEAFIEGYHVAETHYEKDEKNWPSAEGIAAFSCDTKIQYDVFPESRHINRLLLVDGVPSHYVAHKVDEQKTVDVMLRRVPEEMRPKLKDGERARDALADFNRKALSELYGVDLSKATNFDVLDQAQNNIFPNFTIWSTTFAPLMYRFRPWNDSPDQALFEIWFLHPIPDDGREYTVAKENRIGPDEKWEDQPEMGVYGLIVDQDMPNLFRLTKGLKATRKRGITLGSYQESRVRHFHKTYDEYLNED